VLTPSTTAKLTLAEAVAIDLRVARILLRSGNALAARVQLETLAARRQLDRSGLLDLAESRWRTGDLAAASEAVTAYLESGGQDALGYLIAAEATAANGRPGEARKLARQALQELTQPLDAVFAGQPRSSIWPHDPGQPVQPTGTLFAAVGIDAAHGGRIGLTAGARVGDPTHAPALQTDPGTRGGGAQQQPAAAANREPEPGLWDAPEAARPDAQAELESARAALAAGDGRSAAVRLSILLRMSPALAPAVLDLIGQLPGPEFDLLRGDALRLVGHQAAADRAYAAAADAMAGPTTGQGASPTDTPTTTGSPE
jgi:hypothetical protein